MPNLAFLLEKYAQEPSRVLYREHDGAQWRDISVGLLRERAGRWQAAFSAHGFEPGDRVAICVKNSAEWVAVDQAALGMGLVVVPLYVQDNPENIGYCVENSEARLLILENQRVAEGLRRAGRPLPRVVCLQGEGDGECHPVDEWLATPGPFRVTDLPPGTLATLVYTSGTQGRPRGVKLTHDNILANVAAIRKIVAISETDSLLSILPLSHMFERTCGYYTPLDAGTRVIFSRGITQLPEDLATQKPTLLIAVPRIYERFLSRIEQALEGSALKRALFRLTVTVGWKAFKGEGNRLTHATHAVLRQRIASKVLARLGGRVRLSVVGGAPLEPRVAKAFIGLGLPLIQGYGLTEASPVVAANRPEDNEPASVGQPLPGLEIRLNEQNELLVRGQSVMQGYWRDPEATRKVLDADGWLNTGDLAEIRDGRYYIIGRSKDLIVLSNGEKIAPEQMEMAILEEPLFEQAMVVGEGRPFLILIAVVSTPCPERQLIAKANARLRHLPKWARVRRVIASERAWTIDEGLITPTLKTKRAKVLALHTEAIETLYRESSRHGK